MTDARDNPPERSNWFWIIIIGILFAVLAYWFYNPIGDVPADDAAADQQVAGALPSDEFTTAPDGGVPVQLPETPMTSAPVDPATPAGTTTPAATGNPPPTMAE